MRGDGGDESSREDGQAAARVLGPSERVAPKASKEDVRGKRERRTGEPDRPDGVGVEHDRGLDGREPERRGRRVDDSVVGLVEVFGHECRPRCRDLGCLLDGRDHEEEKHQRAGWTDVGDADVEAGPALRAGRDEQRARGAQHAEQERAPDEQGGLATRVRAPEQPCEKPDRHQCGKTPAQSHHDPVPLALPHAGRRRRRRRRSRRGSPTSGPSRVRRFDPEDRSWMRISLGCIVGSRSHCKRAFASTGRSSSPRRCWWVDASMVRFGHVQNVGESPCP